MESTTRRSHRRRLYGPLLASALLIATAIGCDRDPSWDTYSFYIASTSREKIGHLGCYSGGKQGRMTMFFGAPTSVNGVYGTRMWAARHQSTATIAELAKSFVRGYVWCRENSSYQLLIGLGTSNSTIDSRTDRWLSGHGRSWARMVRSVANWADTHYPGVVRFYAAWDAEPSWSAYNKAASWMDGYMSVGGHRPLYANFSADGCSWTSSDNAGCNNGWTQRRVWALAWQRSPSMPIPQIYATSGVNARQWQKISEYGARHHDRPLFFYGTMTQYGACMQVGGCDRIDNHPHAARRQLLHHLNQSPLTRQDDVRTTTDMRWHS